MDGQQFDNLTRVLGRRPSRRQVLRVFGGVIGTALGLGAGWRGARLDARAQGGSRLTRLRAHNNATNNFYAYDFSGTYAFHRVYLDTDQDASTGFRHCGLGANYLLENSRLHRYSGTGSTWSWTPVGDVAATIGTSSASWTVARSSIGEAAFPNRARMCFETETATDVRDTSAIYTHVYTDETLPIHAHGASNDDTTIYYRATFDTPYSHKHVFIDVDENAATGYRTGGIGAEYMIENATLYRYTGNGATWSWTPLGSANMSPATVGATGVTTWSIARGTIGETGTAERADLVFHGRRQDDSSTFAAVYKHVYSGGGGSTATVVDTSYTADTNHLLKNPERGMYFGSRPNTPEEFHTIVPRWLWLAPVCGVNLVWNGYNKTGTSSVLNTYAALLEEARAGGYKVLFRPRYDKDDDRNGPSDCTINGAKVFHADSVTRQKNHIDAIAAMLGDYKDAIASIQAGYLGRWGEWNTASYGPDNAPFLHRYATRSEIIDYVLAKYAAEGIRQHVELRRPVFAKQVLDRNPSARVGYHNDCFMTNGSDYGTYSNYQSGEQSNFSSSSDAKLWAQRTLTPNASFGGETCPLDPPGAERWRSCGNMTGTNSEPASLHMTYLNGDYATDAVSTWTAGGCYNEIRRKLGYRFEVRRVEYPRTVRAGQSFAVHVDVANTGWAKLHKPRTAKIVLRSGSASQSSTPSNSNTASWAPGTTTRLSMTATAPATPGTYSVRLAIPDRDAPTRIPYAVKLATLRGGTNVFDTTTGENNLGVSITVQ